MKKEGKVLPIVLTLVLVLGAGFFFIARAGNKRRREFEDKLKEEEEKLKNTRGQQGTLTQSTPSTKATPSDIVPKFEFTFPIKKEDRGENVKQLQLLIMGYDNKLLAPFGADGIFGNVTKSAIVKLINKEQVTSQDDIEAIKTKTKTKATNIFGNLALNAQLGLPINTSLIK